MVAFPRMTTTWDFAVMVEVDVAAKLQLSEQQNRN
jgi:hypothetical protein